LDELARKKMAEGRSSPVPPRRGEQATSSWGLSCRAYDRLGNDSAEHPERKIYNYFSLKII
jgi:hypothetical protein